MTVLHFRAYDQTHTITIQEILNYQQINSYLSDICYTFVLIWFEYDCATSC